MACGTGYWTEILAHSAVLVGATDINEEVLAVARSKRVWQRVTFQGEDAYALPSLSQRFTAGLAIFWWSHVPSSRLHGSARLGFHLRALDKRGINPLLIDQKQ